MRFRSDTVTAGHGLRTRRTTRASGPCFAFDRLWNDRGDSTIPLLRHSILQEPTDTRDTSQMSLLA